MTFQKLNQFLVLYLAFMPHTLASAYSLEEYKTKLSSSNNSHANLACPLWFYFIPSTNTCQCLPFCHWSDGTRCFVQGNHLVTVHNNKSSVSISNLKAMPNLHSGINVTKPGYRLLPENLSELNDFICAPLNRKGYLCGDCIDGFGPSLSDPNGCYKCPDNWHGVLLYFTVVLAPVTLFYLIVITFQIGMTSTPITCLILYSQVISFQCPTLCIEMKGRL